MKIRRLQSVTEPVEARIAWYAASLSMLFAAVAAVPSVQLKVLALAGGAALAVAVAPLYLEHATPFTAVALTVGAAVLSTTTLLRLTDLSLAAGVSCSQAGGAERPYSWLFTTTAWCLAAGLLASGRLLVQAGRDSGRLGPRGSVLASVLAVVAPIGFMIVGACPVGGSYTVSVAHNYSAVTAMGCFCIGMAACALLSSIPRPLRLFSATAALVMFSAWLPTGLRFLHVIATSPITTQHMELLVFSLSFTWLTWLAWEWGRHQFAFQLETAEEMLP
jgi:hypothetical protein